MEFRFRAYRPGDEHQINQGFEEVFKTSRSLAEWRWKFRPEQDQSCILLAVDSADNLIAHFAAIKTRIQIDGALFQAGHAVDNYCLRRPMAVRQRVFEKLVLDFYQRFGFSQPELSFVFGFPGTRHQQLGQLRMGYCQPALLQCWHKPILHRFGWLKRFLKREPPPTFHGTLPELEIDRLWTQVAPSYPVATCRTSTWVVNRYVSRPHNPYYWVASYGPTGLEAWAVISLAGDVVRWVDLVWDGSHSEAISDLETQVLQLVSGTRIQRSEFWLSGDSRLASVLAAHGWTGVPHPLGLQLSAFSFVPEVDAAAFATVCYVTMGDTDLV